MPKRVTIYHNPRCSKSRQALELLRERGIEPAVIEYLKTPPSIETLMELIELLGVQPLDVVRTKEPEYAASGLGKASSAREVAEAVVRAPILLERPIVVSAERAVIGRPPERVLELG
jgi:arsenate reductase